MLSKRCGPISQVNAKISIYPTTWISAASANCLQAAEAINICRAQLEAKGKLRNEMQTHLDKSSSFTVNHSDLKLLELLSCFYHSNLNSKKMNKNKVSKLTFMPEFSIVSLFIAITAALQLSPFMGCNLQSLHRDCKTLFIHI